MKNNARRLLTGVTAAVISLSAVSAADIAALGSAVSAFAEDGVAINEANFPDEIFREYILKFDKDNNNYLSESEISSATFINVGNSGIQSLDGIEYFTSLTSLYCGNNQLTSLDVSNCTALTDLSCYDNQLTSLDVSNCTALTELNCWKNQLTSLDVNKCTALTALRCGYNQLTSLDVSKCTALTELSCYNNQLTSLDVSKNTALTALRCNNNQLTSLDAGNCTALTELYCGENQLTSLDVSNCTALTMLSCYENQLTSLDAGNCTALTELDCRDNQLTSLDVSKCTALTSLGCSDNRLTSLDVSKCTALTSLDCGRNQLTSLDVSKCTALTGLLCENNQLTSLDVSKNTALTGLWCDDNQLTSLDVSKNTALTELWCYGNKYTLKSGSLNELTKYGFDGSKASSWQGAKYDSATNSLKNITSDTVTYKYDLGNNRTGIFTLKTDKISSSDPTPAPTPDPTKPVVKAEPTYGGAEVTWEPVEGAINYRVFTFVPGQKIRQFGSDTKGTSMTVKGLKGGEKTGIIVLAQFANKKWSTYTEDDITYVVPLDAVKPYLCVNPKGNGSYYLIWSSVPTSVRYKVMAREKGTNNWELIGATRQRCRITVQLDANKEYEFLVRGLNAKNKYTPMDADDIVSG